MTISATNAGGTRNATLGLGIATPYAAWQSRVFTANELANPAIGGDLATPMDDGMPNLITLHPGASSHYLYALSEWQKFLERSSARKAQPPRKTACLK